MDLRRRPVALLVLLAVLLFVALALAGRGSGSGSVAGGAATGDAATAGAPPVATGEATADPLADAQLQRFARRCAGSVDALRAAQLDWPRFMALTLGGAAVYTAVVDARTNPLPPDQVLETAGQGGAAAVIVHCTLGATLRPVDSSLQVTAPDAVDPWRAQTFDP